MIGCAFKTKLATKAAPLALPIRSFKKKQVFCATVWQESLINERHVPVSLFLSDQQFATAGAWMYLMGAEKGTEQLQKAQNK